MTTQSLSGPHKMGTSVHIPVARERTKLLAYPVLVPPVIVPVPASNSRSAQLSQSVHVHIKIVSEVDPIPLCRLLPVNFILNWS